MSLKLLKGGYVKDAPDHRDYIYSIIPNFKAIKQPVANSLRPAMPHVLDQGNLGSCVSNAVCNALAFLNIKMGKPPNLKSRIFNYYCTRVLEGTVNQDSGCQIRDAVKVVNQIGDCYETTWPYNISRFTMKPPQLAYTEATKHKLAMYQRVNQDRTSIKSCLAQSYPIIIGFTCYNTLFNPIVDRTGNIPMPTRRDYIIGGHCVLITGYNDSTQTYEIMNSWGTGWGNGGYGTLPYAYVENPNYASDFWMVTKDL